MSNIKVIGDLARRNWELTDKIEKIRKYNDLISENTWKKRNKNEWNVVRYATIEIDNIINTGEVWDDN